LLQLSDVALYCCEASLTFSFIRAKGVVD